MRQSLAMGSEEIEVGDGLRILRKHRGFALLVVAATLVSGVGLTLNQERLYSASCELLIQPLTPVAEPSLPDVFEHAEARALAESDRYYNTQQDLIAGEAVARRVVARLELAKGVTEAEAVKNLRAMTRLHPSLRSQIVGVTVTHRSPELAATLANAIAEEYQTYVVELRGQLVTGKARGSEPLLPLFLAFSEPNDLRRSLLQAPLDSVPHTNSLLQGFLCAASLIFLISVVSR